jgi:octaprenyl-diphosphate synthase
MKPAERARVDALFANENPSDAQVVEVIRIVTDNGGLEYARQQGIVFAEQAREALSGLPDTVARTALLESISYVMERHA